MPKKALTKTDNQAESVVELQIQELSIEIEKIKERNLRVSANKAWETSFTRKVLLVLVTYLIVGLCLMSIHNPQPWLNAIIPSIGFFISTLTMPVIKRTWIEIFYKNSNKF